MATLKERFPNSPEATKAEQLDRKQSGGGLPPAPERPVEQPRFPGAARHGAGGQKGLIEANLPGYRHGPGDRGHITRELAQDESVLAILGPLSSVVAQSAASAAQTAGVPLIALSQKDGLTQTGNWIFQAFLTPSAAGPGRGAPSPQHGNQALRHSLPRFHLWAHLFPEFPGGGGGRRR